jgi:5'-nucleotidase / UDP-sugar diphosphatase
VQRAPSAGRSSALFCGAVLFLTACHEGTPPGGGVSPAPSVSAPAAASATAAAAAARPAVTVTLLYTSDEHGWLLPVADKSGVLRGGAAEMLGRLIAHEAHCAPSGHCAEPGTLLLSGGDNYTGPAISSYFDGQPMAETMARMGYAASAFGNHEFDFGREQFVENRARAAVTYLAANVHAQDPALKKDMDLPAFSIFERRGVKIGVVGLTTETTLTSAMASRFEGMAIDPAEPALERSVAEAWAAGPDALVLIAHECPDKLKPMLERHPDWGFAFAGGGHCHRVIKVDQVAGTPLYSPGWRFENYLRVRLHIDPSRPPRARVVTVEPELIEVSRREGDPVVADAELARSSSAWQAKLERALGEEIGYAATGFDKGSAEIAHWITEAWRREFKVDVALVNTGGIRQALPKGPITKATVWSILPFDNKIVICEILGSDLLTDLEGEEAAFTGVTRSGKSYRMEGGAPLDPKRRYRVATVDFLYYGGANYAFQKQDPRPKETDVDWRVPVIDWTRKLKTNPSAPLEQRLGATPAGAAKRL